MMDEPVIPLPWCPPCFNHFCPENWAELIRTGFVRYCPRHAREWEQ